MKIASEDFYNCKANNQTATTTTTKKAVLKKDFKERQREDNTEDIKS